MTDELGFIDPTAKKHRAKVALAARPMDLTNKVVALLDNTKEQGDVILATMAEALRERYGVARVIVRRKEHFSKPAIREMLDEMAGEAQVAIAALGG